MNFPKFWAKGTHEGFDAWRWSDTSLAEAATAAQEAARRVADKMRGGHKLQNRYAYADRPLREPVLQEFKDADGNLSAVVTRNSYGCDVLNTARIAFVDVDLPEPKSSGGGFFSKLFGKPEPPPKEDPQSRVIHQARAWADKNPGWGWRIYRTKAGLRLLATHALFDPASVEPLFDALGADPLYRQLCRIQKCFRARLTPKPWRIGKSKPPGRWPWPNEKAEARFNKWQTDYWDAAENYATCDLITTIGPAEIHPDIQTIVTLHDEDTRATSKLTLA